MKTGDGRYILLTTVLNTSALCSCTHQSDLNHCTLLPASANNILYFLRSGSNSNILSSPFSFLSFPQLHVFPIAAVVSTWALRPSPVSCAPGFLMISVLSISREIPRHDWLVSSDALLTFPLRVSTKCVYAVWGSFILNMDISIGHQLFDVFSHCFFGFIFVPTFFPGTSIVLRRQQLWISIHVLPSLRASDCAECLR